MKRTQIQIPDPLFEAATDLARTKEISMAELVRRGLEYMLATAPQMSPKKSTWKPPTPEALTGIDPFGNENWRADLHMRSWRVAEDSDRYGEDK